MKAHPVTGPKDRRDVGCGAVVDQAVALADQELHHLHLTTIGRRVQQRVVIRVSHY